MNASRLVSYLLVAAFAASAGWVLARRDHAASHAAASGSTGERKVKFYQSPMHPWIKSDQPGKCTICGMTLAPVYEGDTGFSGDANLVTLAPASASVVGVKTSEVRSGPLTRTLRVAGIVEDDETRHRYVSSYTDARIEKLFVHTTGQEIAAGAPLAVVYSPELLTARQEFHALARGNPDSTLARAAREKLRRLGLLDAQIDALATAESVTRDTEILSPLDGIVVERSTAAYVGGYVKAGDALFTLGDFAKMWFIFDAYEPDLPVLSVGQKVEVTVPSLPGETRVARIDFIDPNLVNASRTAKVRVVLDNADRRLRHRQTADARVEIATPDLLLVPRSAILHTRSQPLVYVSRGEQAYEARPIRLGRIGDEFAEVLSGIAAGDQVVTHGALLLDSQAQLAHSTEPAPAATAPTATPSETTSPVAAAPLPATLTLGAADAAAALAADDLAAYAKLLPALTSAVHQSGAAHDQLMPLAAKLAAGPDLAAARAGFEPFSTAVADLVRAQPAARRENLRIFQCPMTPVLGKGRWLQRDAALKNPFFGSEMLECGEEIR